MNDTPAQFSDLKLDPKVLQAVSEAGYTAPTPIQLGAIPPALEGRDVLGIAQTGTGKTAGFVLPMITLLGRGRARARMPRSLVLCPTRELAAQVAENFDTYAKHTRLTKALLIGGVSFSEQDKLIDRGVDVLIATPGRLLDHFERGKLLLTGVQIMVVDEADRMLDMGFIPDIERIFTLTPFTRQTLFFSATMAPEIERITDTFLHAPARIEVARQATASETITQRLVEITPTRKDQTAKQKRELMRALIDAEGEALKNAIIFCNRKTEVDVVAKSLKAHGYDAAPIHGDLDQSQRTRTLEGFREGTLRFLVASDVAARGLDIPAVSHVFNFDLPSHAEDYVHRIGRTGRAGREGTAISLAVPADEKYLAAIEGLLKKSLPRASVPEGFSLSEAAQNAPRSREERGGREGSRGRSRGGRDRRGEAQRPAVEAPAAREARAEPHGGGARGEGSRREEPRREERRAPAREGRPEARPEARGEDRGHDRRDDRRRDEPRGQDHRREDRRRDERKDDRRPAVVGLGDHMPDFLTRSFRTSLTPMEGEFEEAPRGGKADAVPAAAVEPAAEAPAASSRGRGRNRRSQKPARADLPAEPAMTPAPETAPSASEEPVAVTVAAGTGPAVESPVAETPAETLASAEAPAAVQETTADASAVEMPAMEAPAIKPARAPRTRRTKSAPSEEAKAAAPEEQAAPEAAADAPAARRSRSRRKPASIEVGEAAAPTAEAEDAAAGRVSPEPAPRRTRARRKPATTDAGEAAALAAGTEEPVAEGATPAPRRTRSRRKPAAEAAAPSEAALPEPAADAPVVRDEA